MFGLIPFRTNNANLRGESLSDFFDDFFNDDFLTPFGMNMDMRMGKFNADVRETENEYLICAELPGVNKNDISLDYKNNTLTISAKREEVHDESKDSYIRKERSYGQFSRSFYFDNVKLDKKRGTLENGKIKIILPKEIETKENNSGIFIE